MKKITSLLSLVLVSSLGFAQSNLVTAKQMGDSNAPTVVFDNQTNSSLAPCEQEVLSNNFENGWGPTNNPSIIWADDFVVNANETLTVNQISLNMLLEPGKVVDSAEIFFYENGGYGPGDEILSLPATPVASSTFIGAAFGFDATELVFDIDPLLFEGASTETIYWVGFVVSYNGANSYFEVTTLVNTPNQVFVYDASDDSWIPGAEAFADPQAPSDFVMKVSGECGVLGVNNNALSQVAVYPNPTTGVLNLQTPSNVDVNSVAIYDILGKRVNADYSNGTINMSALSTGVYLLKAETSAGTFTQKIVKQ